MGNIFGKQTKNDEPVAAVGQATKPLKREAEVGINENQVAAKKQKKESFGSEEESILNEVGNTGSTEAADHEPRAPSGTETTKAGSEEKDGDAERSEETDEEQPQRIKTKQVPKRRFTVYSDSDDSYSRSNSQYSGYSYSSYDSGSSCTSFYGKESSEEGECYWEDEIKQSSSDESSDESFDETSSEEDDQTYDEDEEQPFKANNDVEMTDAGSAQAQTKLASSMAAAAPLGETLETKAVFVRNLSKDVEEADLEKFFQEAGEIARVYLAATKIFAYVEFTTVEAAQKATKLRGQKLLDCAVRLRLTSYRLPRDTSDRLLAAVASLAASRRDPLPCAKDSPQGVGEIADIHLALGMYGLCKSFGHVEFQTIEAAQKALRLDSRELLDHVVELKANGQSIPSIRDALQVVNTLYDQIGISAISPTPHTLHGQQSECTRKCILDPFLQILTLMIKGFLLLILQTGMVSTRLRSLMDLNSETID
ncbi:hypothetical protein RJ639_035290 [Escallonia herrerae]|uniref:RRM domain-containing protein n=1 Tax=Escallonia herrerae TaxID=1293975 RepID=A0AA88WRG0_9ASTE|nr:hypothetical protein RJ639_035290 [Escallonia herrerae]